MNRQRKKKMRDYKQYNLEELQNMFDKEQNLEELNQIMGATLDKQDVLYDHNEEANNIQL